MEKIYASKTMESKYQRKTFEEVRYTLMTLYEPDSTKTEGTNDFIAALEAAAIYLRDPDCYMVKIWDNDTGDFLLDYWKHPDP